MTSRIDARLAELGLSLPETPAPVANDVPLTIAGKLVFISGQVSNDGAGGARTARGEVPPAPDGYLT